MAYIIDGKKIAEKIKDAVVREIVGDKIGDELLNSSRPNLAIVLIGEREDSELYVSLKEREAKKCGIDTHLYKCPADANEEDLLEMIKFLNEDEEIDAILVQLPLPPGFNTDKIVAAVSPAKDVDGFHPDNIEILAICCEGKTCPSDLERRRIMPPVFEAVLEILKSINYELGGKNVCVAANSDIFGKSLSKVLECRGAEVFVVGASDKNLGEKTSAADVLITAVGKPRLIKKEMVKKDAVVIDIGIVKEGGKTLGDVDFEEVKKIAGYITPVPGGVGPMTIACLFKNTVALFKERNK